LPAPQKQSRHVYVEDAIPTFSVPDFLHSLDKSRNRNVSVRWDRETGSSIFLE
jgi:hypothetical protein